MHQVTCVDLVECADDHDVMGGLLVTQIWLLFSYFDPYCREDVPCALVTWLIHPDEDPEPDEGTGMWRLHPEQDADAKQPVQVIHLDAILCGAHLLPCYHYYGEGFLPVKLNYTDALILLTSLLTGMLMSF